MWSTHAPMNPKFQIHTSRAESNFWVKSSPLFPRPFDRACSTNNSTSIVRKNASSYMKFNGSKRFKKLQDSSRTKNKHPIYINLSSLSHYWKLNEFVILTCQVRLQADTSKISSSSSKQASVCQLRSEKIFEKTKWTDGAHAWIMQCFLLQVLHLLSFLQRPNSCTMSFLQTLQNSERSSCGSLEIPHSPHL